MRRICAFLRGLGPVCIYLYASRGQRPPNASARELMPTSAINGLRPVPPYPPSIDRVLFFWLCADILSWPRSSSANTTGANRQTRPADRQTRRDEIRSGANHAESPQGGPAALPAKAFLHGANQSGEPHERLGHWPRRVRQRPSGCVLSERRRAPEQRLTKQSSASRQQRGRHPGIAKDKKCSGPRLTLIPNRRSTTPRLAAHRCQCSSPPRAAPPNLHGRPR